MVMQYYRLESIRSPFFATVDGVGDKEGRGLDAICDDRDHARWIGYTPAEEVDRGWTTISRKGRLPDVFDEPRFYLLVSPRAKAIMDRVEGMKNLTSVPTTVLDEKGIEIAEYYFIYTRTRFNPLDMDRSTFEYFPGRPDTPSGVIDYVFVPDRLPAADIFQTSRFIQWIVTDRLKKQFDKEKIIGCRFVPIWSGPSPLDDEPIK
jgi:hypothetical protein